MRDVLMKVEDGLNYYKYSSIWQVNQKGEKVKTPPTEVYPPIKLVKELEKNKGRGVVEVVIEFSSEDAYELLKLNNLNKDLRTKSVKKFREIFMEGKYNIIGDNIYVSSHGELLGGQHRLVGLYLAGVTAKLRFSLNDNRQDVLSKDEHTHRTRDIINQTVLGADKNNQKMASGYIKFLRAKGERASEAKKLWEKTPTKEELVRSLNSNGFMKDVEEFYNFWKAPVVNSKKSIKFGGRSDCYNGCITEFHAFGLYVNLKSNDMLGKRGAEVFLKSLLFNFDLATRDIKTQILSEQEEYSYIIDTEFFTKLKGAMCSTKRLEMAARGANHGKARDSYIQGAKAAWCWEAISRIKDRKFDTAMKLSAAQ